MKLEYKLVKETGPELSEYDIIASDKITVDEFISYVLKERPDEKGTIGIADAKHKHGEPRMTFGEGISFSRSYLKDYLDASVCKVHAYKFCGLMLYVITPEKSDFSIPKRMSLFDKDEQRYRVVFYEDNYSNRSIAIANFKHVHEIASMFKDYKNFYCRILDMNDVHCKRPVYEGVFSNYFADSVVAYIKELESKIN